MQHRIAQAGIAIATLALMSTAPLAQDHSGHGGHAGHEAAGYTPDLPAICLANAGDYEDMAMSGHDMGGDQAHQDLMEGMDAMNTDMMLGGTATDIDVAFMCSMLPHHRGAVTMAKAELAHGDDPVARALAEQIIASQEREIAEMLEWLEKQAQ